MTKSIESQLERLQKRHNLYLQNLLSNQLFPSQLLHEAIEYALFPGGKRIRPILVYLIGDILNVSPDCLDIIAAAIELTHSYSLIHDDLPAMDNDDFRRGKLSCHKAFHEGVAILAGDALQIYAVQLLIQKLPQYLSPQKVIAIVNILCESSGIEGMISGQCFDLYPQSLNGSSEKVQPIENLRQIHELKTGKLIMACIEMTIAAQQETPQLTATSALRTFGHQLGFTYQIQDDYLDRYAPRQILGKNRSSDLSNQKITFASYYSREELYSLITEHYQSTIESLEYFGEKADLLRNFTEQLINRS